MMNYDDAKKVAEAVRAIGGFTEVQLEHYGFLAEITDAAKNDGRWSVELWSVNARAGNRTCYSIRDMPRDEKHLKLLIKAAKGKATERDRAALGRIASERANA
jgi:hypothetical protein